MKRTRFSEEQIIGVLKDVEVRAKTADLAQSHDVSEGTVYNWKSKYGGLEVSEARRLKALEDENGNQQQDKRTTFYITDRVELGVAASACLGDNIGQGPPFAPPAVRWTLMQVLSMKRRSGT